MPPRPTPRQRAVLEAMSRGVALRFQSAGRPWFLDDGSGDVHGQIVNALWRRQWIKRAEGGLVRHHRGRPPCGRAQRRGRVMAKAREHVIAELRTKATRFYAASMRMSLPGNADFTAEQARLYRACADWLERNGDRSDGGV